MTNKKIMYVGIDVDDKAFHGAGLDLNTGELKEFRCKPDAGVLLKKLKGLFDSSYEIRLCYEACHIGYSLCRKLNKAGVYCDIIAPSLIPKQAGNRVKTDRLDARKLAEYYAKGLLTPIYIPTEEDEEVRDVIRSRGFLVRQRKQLKKHILSVCRRYEIHYQKETGGKSNWSKAHLVWLRKITKSLERVNCRIDLELLLSHYSSLSNSIEVLDDAIARIAENNQYKVAKDALISFRGISILTAMTLITEIGDVRRFSHPRKLTAYAGLDIAEYSSGGKEKKGGITKTGNKRIRTILTESCQLATLPPSVSRPLKRLREGQPVEIVNVADRCMKRLHKKATRMLYAGKHRNKIKTACAREMLCFVWEALYLVPAAK